MSGMMPRDSVAMMELEGRKRGMSYGQYVAAAYYPVIIVEPVEGGENIRRAKLPPVMPEWEEAERLMRSWDADGKGRKASGSKKAPAVDRMRTCAECGQEFEGTSHNSKYCGEECRRRATSRQYRERKRGGLVRQQKAQRKVRECGMCGRAFETANPLQKYCGAECSAQATRIGNRLRWLAEFEQRPKKHCMVCGRELQVRQIKYCADCAIVERKRQQRAHKARTREQEDQYE